NGRLRIILAQALRVPTIDAGVVLLGGDRGREHLLLGQVPELPLVQKTRDHRGSNASTDVGARGRERILPFRPRANFPSVRHWPQGCRSLGNQAGARLPWPLRSSGVGEQGIGRSRVPCYAAAPCCI